MDQRFLESWVNKDSHAVLRRRLHPYCLYDLMFLLIDSNPLALQDKPISVSLADLQTAVLICSSRPELLLNSRPLFPSKLLLWIWQWRCRRMSLEKEVAKFVQYIKDFDARPKFWESEGGGELRAPWILSVAAFLEDHSNMTHEQIMAAPIGQMLWKSATLGEQLGMSSSDLLTEDEEEAMAEMGIKL